MIALIIGLIGFMMADGALGLGLIQAFDWMNTWYWVGVILLSVLSAGLFAITTISGTAVGLDANSKVGAFLGGIGGMMAGGFISFLILIKSVVLIWVTYWLVDNIDPTITEFSQLETKEMIAMISIVVLVFLGRLSGNTQNTSSK